MYWTCLSHTTTTPKEFMPRFEHPCCFLSFRTTIVHTNSHPGLFMFPFVTLVFSQPPSQSLSTESKYPPIQNATKQLMKTEAWDCARSIHPLYLYFILLKNVLMESAFWHSTHNTLCLIFCSCYRQWSFQTCMFPLPNTKERFHRYRQPYLM